VNTYLFGFLLFASVSVQSKGKKDTVCSGKIQLLEVISESNVF
jgi:hypothetical protein